MPTHRTDDKITKSHTTVTDSAKVVVNAAIKIAEVTKVSLGIIKRGRNGLRRLKFKELAAGWQIDVIDNASMQRLIVYTSAKEETRQILYESWPGA